MNASNSQNEIRRVRRPRPTDAESCGLGLSPIEIKICGITTPAAAAACSAAGTDAIGMVFHPASPRNLAPAQARMIAAAIPAGVAKVGVFVDQTPDEVLRIVAQVGLDTVQWYGTPDVKTYAAFARHRLRVVQVLRSTGNELLTQSRALPPNVGLMVECGRGPLLGGTGVAWNWAEAAILREIRPFAVAGGLDAANVAQAIAASGASAVDVSTGVEASPGVKHLGKVIAFVAAVRASGARSVGQVFSARGITNSELRIRKAFHEQRSGAITNS